MQFLSVRPLRFYASPSASAGSMSKQRHGLTARLLQSVNRPWAAGLASFVATAILLLPAEYEMPVRSLMLFLSSRRF
ncbi:hypothetical protein [Sphingomonas echinoides]|uniref:hypothetical protein n=1 Tax=Sphingomonas echinoides TaxID=59803 RepID=UPI0024136EAC|nr:hypothetical protein [Sphingomonas echinoides]